MTVAIGQRHDRVIKQPLVMSGGVVEEETLAHPLPTGFGAIVIAIKFSNSKNIRANRERETGRRISLRGDRDNAWFILQITAGIVRRLITLPCGIEA